MATVYVCTNPSCNNNTEYSSPGKCPDCKETLEAQLAKVLEYEPER